MSHLLDTRISCGVQQLFGLELAPIELIKKVVRRKEREDGDQYDVNTYSRGYGHIVFSDWTRVNNGLSLAQYITENGLGEVVSSVTRNPNSGNTIQTWVWAVNNEALNTWASNNP